MGLEIDTKTEVLLGGGGPVRVPPCKKQMIWKLQKLLIQFSSCYQKKYFKILKIDTLLEPVNCAGNPQFIFCIKLT
jgi:hypothetical protein